MTKTGERIDGRIRDLAELCTRHGTPCADGLLAEIGRLRTEIESARMRRDQAYDERDAALVELSRTDGDLGVAAREATRAREALKAARPIIDYYMTRRRLPAARAALRLVDAALDQRLTR